MPPDRTTPIRSAAAEPLRRASAGRYAIELLPRQGYEAAYTPRQAVIGFAFEGQTGVHAFASDRRAAFRTPPNSLAFVPAGCDVYSQSRGGGEYLTLSAVPNLETGVATPDRFNDVVAPPAIKAARTLRRLLLAGAPHDPLIVEQHALTLAEAVAAVLGSALDEPDAATWMTSRRRQTIEDLIEAKLDTALTLDELAGAVGLSAGFLSRAFKAAMGMPPHAYIIDRRIARARVLLRSGDRTLTSIAYACGFSSHAHMTAAFRARLGATPSALRFEAGLLGSSNGGARRERMRF